MTQTDCMAIYHTLYFVSELKDIEQEGKELLQCGWSMCGNGEDQWLGVGQCLSGLVIDF